MTQTIGRTFQFEAAHSLADILPPDHICSRLHGHSYEVEVKIAGELQNGMVRGIQFEAIDLVMENLLRLVDHRLLNELITTPTVEYISLWFAEHLRKVLNVPVTVRVYEGPKSWAEATAE